MRNTTLFTLAVATLAASLAPAAASAQGRHGGWDHDAREYHHDQRDYRRDMAHEAREDRREWREDRREARRDYREARRDYREDWRDYRRAHADRFRGPAYMGPEGYVYRPVGVGYRFAPPYYDRRYWVADPSYYRLPPVGPRERWVRYGRDVVRVDISTGRTLQVFASFFL